MDESFESKSRRKIEPEPPQDYFMHDKNLDNMLYAQHADIESKEDLELQRGTSIPALFSIFYRFLQNPSSVSLETMKRMVDTDDTVGSGVDFLVTCLASRIGPYKHENPEVTKFVQEALDGIKGGWFGTKKEILTSTWAGFSVSEKVWKNTEKGFLPEKIVTLPPLTIFFEADREGELTPDGILQYQRGYTGAWGGSFFGYNNGFSLSILPDSNAKLGDLPFPTRTSNTYSYMSIRIPVQKVIHHAFDSSGKFGNPYGRSLLRRAYKHWVLKDATLKMLAVALDRKGTPLTIIYADPNATLMDGKSYNEGASPKDQKRTRADLAAREAFKNIHNDSYIVLPGKKGQIYDLDFAAQDPNAQAFIDTINLCNKSILRSLLIPPLVFNDGDGGGSYALGQEHSETFFKILDGMNAGVMDTLIHQLVKEIIIYNFPESSYKKDGFGTFQCKDFSMSEREKMATMYEQAINSGYVDVNDLSDLNTMRDGIGFIARDKIIERKDDFGMDENPKEGQDENGSDQDEKATGNDDGSGKEDERTDKEQ